MEESLYFSTVETSETDSHVSESINTNISAQENEDKIRQDILVEENESENSSLSIHNSAFITTTKPKRELPKSSAIGSLYKDIHQEVVTVKDENKIELSAENVISLWQEFLAENKDKLQNAFLSAAQEQVPDLVEDKITFTASNNISLEMLQLHKMDITAYFRKRTTSNTVVPAFILKRDTSQQKNYKTSKDRLKEMIAANNSVLKLIEKLDLNEY
ncbi:MAG: hypothetical protein U0T69_12195 [Chitinophagales bacterium]